MAKLLLAILATIVLLLHTQPISYSTPGAPLLGLLVATTLSVYKPRGMTRCRQRKQHASGSIAEKLFS